MKVDGRPDIFLDLRARALGVKPSDLNLNFLPPDAAYGALMDLNINGAHASVVGFSNGEASIYLSSGGGFIGGGQRAAVSSAAKAFVTAASNIRSQLKPVSRFHLPNDGITSFYVITPEAVLFGEEWDDQLTSGNSPFRPLFSAGQDVISAYRTLPITP
ncbi:MAG: hypothetical protein JO056_05250 [Alphaproteobacteria bacterium]|nr:hypothetical protein [Alphaproteobacteria bacterium]